MIGCGGKVKGEEGEERKRANYEKKKNKGWKEEIEYDREKKT